MVSAHALQGTARAPHYHVLENEANLTLGELERFTYDLCFFYARATKIVSRPAPLYYAHRAAYLGQYYNRDFCDGGQRWDAASTSSGGSTSSLNVGGVLIDVRRNLYYA